MLRDRNVGRCHGCGGWIIRGRNCIPCGILLMHARDYEPDPLLAMRTFAETNQRLLIDVLRGAA